MPVGVPPRSRSCWARISVGDDLEIQLPSQGIDGFYDHRVVLAEGLALARRADFPHGRECHPYFRRRRDAKGSICVHDGEPSKIKGLDDYSSKPSSLGAAAETD